MFVWLTRSCLLRLAVLSPPKSPAEPADGVLNKQYSYLDILSEEDSDLEDLCLVGGRPNFRRAETAGMSMSMSMEHYSLCSFFY